MLKLIIEDDEGRKTIVPFVRDEITIGRQEGNTIRLTERNVSRRHARLLRVNGHVVVEDLGSYNGIRVNGEKVVGRADVQDGDLIQIGDYDLAIQHEAPAELPPPSLQNGVRKHTPPSVPAHPGPAVQASVSPPLEPEPGEEPETEAAAPLYESDKIEDTAPSSAATDREAREAAEAARRHATSIIRVEQVEANRPRQVADLEPEEAPRLVVVNTEFAGREFACIRTELRIGRADDNDISLDHRSLSRTHAKLVREASGEWRVVDLQSANGMKVNGEPYAQATVEHLDTIELGHLRLRFVGAGEKYTFNASAEERAERRQAQSGTAAKKPSKAPLFVGLALLLVVGGGAAAWFVVSGQGSDAGAVDSSPAPVAVTGGSADGAAPGEAPSAPDAAHEAKDTKDALREQARKLLGTYGQALAAGDLGKARTALTGAEALGELPPELLTELQEAQAQLAAEQDVPRRLEMVEKALAAGKFDQARELLQDNASTIAFASRHAALSEQVEAQAEAAAQAAARAAAEKQAQANAVRQATERAPAAPVAEDVQKMADQAIELMKKNKEVRPLLDRCVRLDPNYPKCHLLLGVMKFRTGDQDAAMPHFETYLKLAPPDEKDAVRIRTLVADHKKSKQAP